MGDVHLLDCILHNCDFKNGTKINRDDMRQICDELDLTTREADDIFKQLDQDDDGEISIKDITNGIRTFQKGTTHANSPRANGNFEDLETIYEEAVDENENSSVAAASYLMEEEVFEDSFSDNDDSYQEHKYDRFMRNRSPLLYCLDYRRQEQVCDLYQQLHTSEASHLLPQLENVVLGVIKDVNRAQLENERLEQSFKREKEQHERHLHRIEDEMETQVQKLESQIQKQEREHVEFKWKDEKESYEAEIAELKSQVNSLKKLERRLEQGNHVGDQVVSIKRRLEDVTNENRYLKCENTESQTAITLLRSEITALKQQFQEKDYELECEKDGAVEYIKETEQLSQQIQLLQEANKRLHDTNDDLREAVEASRAAKKRTTPQMSTSSMHSTGRFSSTPAIEKYIRHLGSTSSLADEISQTEGQGQSEVIYQRHGVFSNPGSCDLESLPDDIDSGHSTLRELNDSEVEVNNVDEPDRTKPRQLRKINPVIRSESGTDREGDDSNDEMDTEIELANEDLQSPRLNHLKRNRPGSGSSWGSQRSNHSRTGSIKRQLPTIPSEPSRLYKIVLAGDAAVGKSSFIMRLCKGKFVDNLNSTLGVDFQTKVLDLDGTRVALQLWDTAGQERFRSIAKTYFRRADGVLLLYDTTYERSFINVREWIDAIEDGAAKQVPIMMCGNKTDAREDAKANGRKIVRMEDGQRLAREYNSMFIETSAKDGSNITEAVIELARWLKTNEDIEVKSVAIGLQLHADLQRKPKKKSCC